MLNMCPRTLQCQSTIEAHDFWASKPRPETLKPRSAFGAARRHHWLQHHESAEGLHRPFH